MHPGILCTFNRSPNTAADSAGIHSHKQNVAYVLQIIQ